MTTRDRGGGGSALRPEKRRRRAVTIAEGELLATVRRRVGAETAE